MFIKLFRRRRLFLYCITGLLFFAFIAYLNHSLDDHVNLKSKQYQEREKVEQKVVVNKNRVNMQNYVPPPPCNGCPGENGGAVQLTVIC
jgi:hypothetical protein